VRIVRDALKADPSILRDAVVALQADDASRDAADSKLRIAANHTKLYARPGDAVAGNPNADTAMVEFYDPRCPYCKRMLPALEALLHADHGVRLIYKEIPVLGPASVTESRAILAAQNQGGYFKMQSALMSSAAEPTEAMIRRNCSRT
jgi:protein-disulfide isomerase